jgi:hypothetical protein
MHGTSQALKAWRLVLLWLFISKGAPGGIYMSQNAHQLVHIIQQAVS